MQTSCSSRWALDSGDRRVQKTLDYGSQSSTIMLTGFVCSGPSRGEGAVVPGSLRFLRFRNLRALLQCVTTNFPGSYLVQWRRRYDLGLMQRTQFATQWGRATLTAPDEPGEGAGDGERRGAPTQALPTVAAVVHCVTQLASCVLQLHISLTLRHWGQRASNTSLQSGNPRSWAAELGPLTRRHTHHHLMKGDHKM